MTDEFYEMREKMKVLQLALDVSEAARVAAEAGQRLEQEAREAAEAAQVAAEAAQAAAEASQAAAEAAQAAAEAGQLLEHDARIAAEKEGFFKHMRGIGSSSSGDTTSNSDLVRRGGPPTEEVPLEDIFDGAGVLEDDDELVAVAADAWAAFKTAHAAEWAPPTAAAIKENKHVHPSIKILLRTLVPSYLRLWCNGIAVDDIDKAEIKPDFTFTHVRDALTSLLGGVLLVEVKLPGDMDSAVKQAIIYARRRLLKMYAESSARGVPQQDLCSLYAYAVATDGTEAVIVRVRSGVPLDPEGYAKAVPCPADISPRLTLLGGWNFLAQPAFIEAPPKALYVLLQLLNKSEVLLGPDAPLSQVSAEMVAWDSGASVSDAPFPHDAQLLHLRLGPRLGMGGTSDAYVCEGIEVGKSKGKEAGGAGGGAVGIRSDWRAGAFAGTVLKTARFTSEELRKCFVQERLALQMLAGTAATLGTVPLLLGSGMRSGVNAWPVLLLEPRGTPLCDWIGAKCQEAATAGGVGGGIESSSGGGGSRDSSGGSSGGGGATTLVAAARVRLANLVCLDILGALEAAHALSLIHCDVRPSNIVVAGTGKAVLIDWGISRTASEESSGCGVAAYADERVYLQGSYIARPAQDLCALLHTWLSVAHSYSCSAPWLGGGLKCNDAMFAARKKWFLTHRHYTGVDKVEQLLQDLSKDRGLAGGGKKQLHSDVRKFMNSM